MNRIKIIRYCLERPLMTRFEDSDSSSTTTSDSDSSLILDEYEYPLRKRHKRTENYFNITIPLYSDNDFKRQFRMSRQSVNNLCELLLLTKRNVGGWPEISKEKAVHITIWYLANTNTFREVADKFDITESACFEIVKSVTESLKKLSDVYIKLPRRIEYAQISEKFLEKGGLPYVIGVIDGTHFEIPKPTIHQEDYYNRKSYHSIIMQGLVDHNKIFNDIYVGEPGSLHDARVFRKSPLYMKVQEENLITPYYILADSAYPASIPWIVPPFRDNGNLTENQRLFNQRLAKQRIVVEHAFGLLKGRFRRLTRFNNKKIDIVINSIVAAVVLHNLCILWDDMEDIDELNLPVEPQQELVEVNVGHENTRRDEIYNMLYNN